MDNSLIIQAVHNLLSSVTTVYVFITGKYASGKSTTTNYIKDYFIDYGVYSIELDNIVNDYIVDKTSENKAISTLNAFKVYKNTASKDDINKFIYYTKKTIENGIQLGNRIILFEGALSSSEICKKIVENNRLLIIYFQPIDHEIHKRRIISRIKSDIYNNTYSLPGYWNEGGYFNREEMKVDIENNVEIDKKYCIILDLVVKNCIEDAKNRYEYIISSFKNDLWNIIVQYT